MGRHRGHLQHDEVNKKTVGKALSPKGKEQIASAMGRAAKGIPPKRLHLGKGGKVQ